MNAVFTGIIEEKATIAQMNDHETHMELKIKAEKIMQDMKEGDSISINGVCLTVTDFDENMFQVDVMPETMKSTSLQALQENSRVNVERAMAANNRFGGHFVSGHVDAAGRIASIEPLANAVYIHIEVPEQLMPYMMLKGSVTLDGISLTLFGVDDAASTITVSIIPHTWEETNLSTKQINDPINVECDVLMKYTERLLETKYKKA